MSKLAPTSIKYLIKAHISADGVIEKPDVIGAIFGQTEGLLGSDMDLRELQKTGKIGRVEVKITSANGKSEGDIVIPSSLDSTETALLASSIETIERVGPCTATIKLLGIEDARTEKRKYVMERSKAILKQMMDAGMPDTSEISEQIKTEVRTYEVTTYHGLPCGPNLLDVDEIVVVEGRADVVNLLKAGVKNCIAVEGTSIPQTVVDLAKEKTITLFVDGDRGGELIFRELAQKTEVDFVAQAPAGKEVEELSVKEVHKALREKVASAEFRARISRGAARSFGRREERREQRYEKEKPFRARVKLDPNMQELFRNMLEELVGSRAAIILDEGFNILGRVPVAELSSTLRNTERPFAVILDGRIDYTLNNIAESAGVRFLIGMEKEPGIRTKMAVLSREDLQS